jgi:hypothetical protein
MPLSKITDRGRQRYETLYSSGRYLAEEKYTVLHVYIAVSSPLIGFATPENI